MLPPLSGLGLIPMTLLELDIEYSAGRHQVTSSEIRRWLATSDLLILITSLISGPQHHPLVQPLIPLTFLVIRVQLTAIYFEEFIHRLLDVLVQQFPEGCQPVILNLDWLLHVFRHG